MVCGEDVTQRTYACIAGSEGFVAIFLLNEAGRPVRCPDCNLDYLRNIRHGNVEVIAGSRSERRTRLSENLNY
jgi:DNA-directed RNA polymerase subunit RPC12/RpoP